MFLEEHPGQPSLENSEVAIEKPWHGVASP